MVPLTWRPQLEILVIQLIFTIAMVEVHPVFTYRQISMPVQDVRERPKLIGTTTMGRQASSAHPPAGVMVIGMT